MAEIERSDCMTAIKPFEIEKMIGKIPKENNKNMNCKYVYVKIECHEFHFHDVKIENDDEYLTIYDKDGILKFRCQIDKIVTFMRED